MEAPQKTQKKNHSLPSIYTKELKMRTWTESCIPIFRKTSFIIAERLQSKCLPTD
jgi:hypothetical protein